MGKLGERCGETAGGLSSSTERAGKNLGLGGSHREQDLPRSSQSSENQGSSIHSSAYPGFFSWGWPSDSLLTCPGPACGTYAGIASLYPGQLCRQWREMSVASPLFPCKCLPTDVRNLSYVVSLGPQRAPCTATEICEKIQMQRSEQGNMVTETQPQGSKSSHSTSTS